MTEPPSQSNARLRRLLAQRLESLHAAGVGQVPRLSALPLAPSSPDAGAIPDAVDESRSISPAPHLNSGSLPAGSSEAPGADSGRSGGLDSTSADTDDARRERLAILQEEVRNCTKCPALVESRTQTVFGVGNIRPRICFFGEAPGRDEDRQGEPFVGAAGQLLNRIIQAMSLQREDVYILNVLKCRPPQNRNPLDDEVACCRHFYEEQLRILAPQFICCLGAYAARTLLETDMSVGRMRNQFFRYGDARVLVTYHPAYLLRNESAKRATWEDIQMLMSEMGLKRT